MISFTNLFVYLARNGMREGEFRRLAGISAPTLIKLRNNETVTTETINRICKAIDCNVSDIMEYIKEED